MASSEADNVNSSQTFRILKNSKHLTKLGIKTNGFSIYGLLVSLLGLTLMKFNNRNAH
ncbi:hypothetical protein SAMN05216385_0998 [Streptococcus equinus]|nr:hypothetical protein SAMN05216385_0998 [Streptococcus equinus]